MDSHKTLGLKNKIINFITTGKEAVSGIYRKFSKDKNAEFATIAPITTPELIRNNSNNNQERIRDLPNNDNYSAPNKEKSTENPFDKQESSGRTLYKKLLREAVKRNDTGAPSTSTAIESATLPFTNKQGTGQTPS